ncbi:tissue factor pathway inhibitor-like [Centruroides vittatus]|uniref:tissue factor pathway inhibitor-like n=1 Tax=Centruroides vittatus TaxID=120091 RepID=UPI003510D1DC
MKTFLALCVSLFFCINVMLEAKQEKKALQPGKEYHQFFFHNYEKNKCEAFIYDPCYGMYNPDNRFETQQQCCEKCGGNNC